MSGFSGALKLGDLDDFLSPANECVVVVPKEETKPKVGIIRPKTDEESKKQIASLSLSDCLACTGCVTSAETMLLESQSVDELLSKSSQHIHVTLSSASRRALARYFNISPVNLTEYIRDCMFPLFGHRLTVTDVATAESISILETVNEKASAPILSSHCPGWTCYATKTLEQSILDMLARTKSGEQIHGLVVKRLVHKWLSVIRFRSFFTPEYGRYLSRFSCCETQNIFQVFVTPCFDKKLEIIRPDYTAGSDRSVDLVLSSTELIDLISRAEKAQVPARFIDIYDVLGLRNVWAPSLETSAVESGGYAHTASRFGKWKEGKNPDLLEGESSLRSRGFRNIQNVTKRVRNGKFSDLKFIEIMACPGGCPRGGGQPVVTDSVVEKVSFFDRIRKWLSTPVVAVNAAEVETACAPAEYETGLNLRRLLIGFFESEKSYYEAIRTEWKSLVVIDEATGEAKTTASDLKW